MKFIILIPLLFLGCKNPTVKEPVKTPEVVTESPAQIEVPSEPTHTPNPAHTGEGSTYTETPKPFPSASGYFTVQIKSEKCPESQVKKFAQAEEFITKLVNSHEFKSIVLGFKYGPKTEFYWNEGMSNEAIYNHVVKGAEALLPTENYQMDITAECYTDKWSKTIGYTNPKTMKIFANMKYHGSYSWYEVAGNTFHEWLHKMGFDHSKNFTQARNFTVPYGLGYQVRDLGKKYSEGKLTFNPIGASLL